MLPHLSRHSAKHLSCVFDAANFSKQRNFYFARIRHFFFDLLGDIACGFHCRFIIDLFGIDYHAYLTACLDSIGIFNTLEAGGDLFEFFKPLDIAFERFSSCSRP